MHVEAFMNVRQSAKLTVLFIVSLICSETAFAQTYAVNLCGRGYISSLRSGEPMHAGSATNASLWIKMDTTGINQSGVVTELNAFAIDTGGKYITVSYNSGRDLDTVNVFDQLRTAMINRLPVRIWTVGPTATKCRSWSNEMRVEVCTSETLCAW